eukprot:gene16502-13021_t
MFSVTSALHRAVQASEVADASVAPARRYAKVQDNKSKFGTSSRFYDHEGTSNQAGFFDFYVNKNNSPAPSLSRPRARSPIATSALPQRVGFSEVGGFPYTTLNKRMPEILTRVIDNVHGRVADLMPEDRSMGGVESEEMVEWKAALAVVNKLSKLKREMQTDKPLRELQLEHRDQSLTDAWNSALHEHDTSNLLEGESGNSAVSIVSWYSAPWLIAECYMYARIHEALGSSSLLAEHDVF